MAKKRKTTKRSSTSKTSRLKKLLRATSFFGGGATQVLSAAFAQLGAETDRFINHIAHKLLDLQDQAAKHLFASMLMGGGVILLLVSGFFYLIEFQQFSKTTAFLALAAAFLVVGFVLKYQFLKEKERLVYP